MPNINVSFLLSRCFIFRLFIIDSTKSSNEYFFNDVHATFLSEILFKYGINLGGSKYTHVLG